MILGILEAIAAPKLLGTSQQATDNSLRHSLSVVRSAIDHFAADHEGQLPGADGLEATFLSDMKGYLRGQLPVVVPGGSMSSDVWMITDGDMPGNNSGVGTHGWCYNPDTGDFHINTPDLAADKVTPYCDF
jgi:type II secretory pathway pseudopilin PulG